MVLQRGNKVKNAPSLSINITFCSLLPHNLSFLHNPCMLEPAGIPRFHLCQRWWQTSCSLRWMSHLSGWRYIRLSRPPRGGSLQTAHWQNTCNKTKIIWLIAVSTEMLGENAQVHLTSGTALLSEISRSNKAGKANILNYSFACVTDLPLSTTLTPFIKFFWVTSKPPIKISCNISVSSSQCRFFRWRPWEQCSTPARGSYPMNTIELHLGTWCKHRNGRPERLIPDLLIASSVTLDKPLNNSSSSVKWG